MFLLIAIIIPEITANEHEKARPCYGLWVAGGDIVEFRRLEKGEGVLGR